MTLSASVAGTVSIVLDRGRRFIRTFSVVDWAPAVVTVLRESGFVVPVSPAVALSTRVTRVLEVAAVAIAPKRQVPELADLPVVRFALRQSFPFGIGNTFGAGPFFRVDRYPLGV